MDQTSIHQSTKSVRPPSDLLEYGYYAILFYGMLGGALGVNYPAIGGGGLLGLALLCAMHFGARSRWLYEPIAFALSCGISIIILQLFFHQESLMGSQLRSYITWVLSLLIIQTLSLRQGFLHRFAIFAFFLGCTTLPFLETYVSTDELTRMGVSHGVGLANPNAFGMWFGFCSVYFIVLGIENRRTIIRLVSWSIGLFCLFLVAITVSRGPLLGVAIGTVVAFQKILKRSFLPLLMFFFLGWIIYISGLFDEVIGYYSQRGAEESGRSALWLSGLEMFTSSWWLGVGLSDSAVSSRSGMLSTPHNSLLFVAIASGIIPLVLFAWYWASAGLKAIRSRGQKGPDVPFLLPLYVFATLEMMTLDAVFMSPWSMVALSAALSTGRGGPIHQK